MANDKINLTSSGLIGKNFSVTAWGKTLNFTDYGVVPDSVDFSAYGGRVNVLPAEITAPSAGSAVARANGSTAMNLLDVLEPQTISAGIVGAGQAAIHVTVPQKGGHPSGEHYWLPLGANGRFVCEPGQRHRKWYFSKSGTALTKAQIAANAGVSEATVTGAWLLSRPQYGGTPQTAIHVDLYALVRPVVVAENVLGRSDHYFLERGYDYTNFSFGGLCGEDELHPLLIGAWGTGADPVVDIVSNFLMFPYTVIQDLKTGRFRDALHQSVQGWYGYATIYDHMDIGFTMDPSNTSFTTIRETTVLTPWRDFPKPDRISNGKWVANGNHSPGIYSANSDGLLIDSCLIDHAGWADGYDPAGDATKPMPQSKYSHAIYTDLQVNHTIRNNFLSRAASCGVQLRTGVHLEGNMLIDNNAEAAVNSFTGDWQYNNVLDNVASSAGYRRSTYGEEGAVNYGYDSTGPLTSLVGNVLFHHANPDDAAELAVKTDATHDSYKAVPTATTEASVKLHNDTQVWKWGGFPNRNVDGISVTTLDQTTIQRRAGSRLGKASATIAEYVAHVAAAPSIGAIVREDVRWTKSRFGSLAAARTAPANLVFQADPRLDGFRWDNRYNWSTFDLPGTHVADSVDLAGNFVRFGTVNADIAALKSSGGLLDVTSGRLEIGTLTDAADMIIRLAGQVWLEAANQPLSVEAVSGRLMLSSAASALDLYAGGQAQVLLGPDATVGADQALIVSGIRHRVGWDGAGTAALTIAGTLEFRRGIEVTVDPVSPGPIRYVHRHIGKTVAGSVSGFTARVAAVERITERGTRYKIWLCDVVGQPVVGDTFTVAPSLTAKNAATPTANTLTISAVGASGVAPLQRFRSGAIGTGLVEPTVTATVTLAGQVVVPAGLPSQDLSGPGVTVVNNGATLPAGVTVAGGKLIYTAPA